MCVCIRTSYNYLIIFYIKPDGVFKLCTILCNDHDIDTLMKYGDESAI